MWIARGPCLAACLAVVAGAGASLAAAAPGDALSACLAGCERARLSETNRATCRLDCEQDAATDPELIRSQIAERRPGAKPAPAPARPSGAAASPPPSGRAACLAGCAADRSLSVDDRATCELGCELVAAPGAAKPPSAAPGPGGPVAVPTGTPVASLGLASSGFLTMCLETCRKGPVKLSETDLATCRLTCENTASVVDVTVNAAPTGWFAAAPAPTAIAARPLRSPAPTSAEPARPKPAPTTVSPPAAGGSCQAARATCEGACEKVGARCERGCGKQRVETDRETCKLECGENLGLCKADCAGEHASCVNRGGR